MASTRLEDAFSRVQKRLMDSPCESLVRGTYPISETALAENESLILSVEKAQALCETCDGLHCKQRTKGMRPALRFDGDLVTEVIGVCPKAIKKQKEVHDFSNIPKRYLGKSFDDIRLTEGNQEAIKALQWCLMNIETEKNGLYLYGSNGLGKTLMTAAFAQEQIRKGVETMFISTGDLLDKLRHSFEDPNSFDFNKVLNVPCLVLDDLGAQRMNAWVASQLFTLFDYRYTHMLQTVITSNYSLQQLRKNLFALHDRGVVKKDENIGLQILSRLAGMCYRVHVYGEDYRFKREEGAC